MSAQGFVLVGSAVHSAVMWGAIIDVGGSIPPMDKFKLDLPTFIEQLMISFANII